METANRRMAAQAMSTLPRYAGGGFIDSFKRVVGLKEDSPELKAYKERAAAERAAAKAPKPAAAAMAEPPKAITGYAGGNATSNRMKAIDAMATGGPIKGPGTGTSDDIPILVSNGEYVIRAAAVEEVGKEVLDAINNLGDDKEPGEAMEAEESMASEPKREFATGGIINKFGTEVPNTEDQQKQLAAQTANYVTGAQATAASRPATQPAPVAAAAPVQSDYSRQMGEVGKFFTGGAETALKTLVSAPGYGFNKPETPSAAPAQTPTMGTQAAPVAAPVQAPPLAKPAMPQASTGAPNPASGSPDEAMSQGNVNVSKQPNGVTSFSGQNVSGQPQYAGSAANIMNSGVMTPQNQRAMDGIQARQDARDQGMRNKAQYDKEVAGAQAVNEAGRLMNLEYEAKNSKDPQRAAVAMSMLSQLNGNSMKTAEMQSADKRFASQQQIEKDRNAQQSQGTALDNQSKQQVLAAQQELANAKTPEQEAAAEKKLRALQGKYGKEAPAEQYAYAPGGQSIDPVTGQAVTQPGVIFNKSTGEVKQQGQQAPKQTFEVNKVYTDAKGNRAKWDGKQFVPA